MNKDFSVEYSERLAQYVTDTFRPEDEALREIRERAEREGLRPIHVGPMDGLHLEVLARAGSARRAVEIGTLAGLSGLCILRGMGEGSRLHTFEFEPEHARVARETFERNGVASQVDLHVGVALDNLGRIEKEGPFDLVFIDADKPAYPDYLQWAVRHLRVGGLLIGDNTFGFGMIADDAIEDAEDREKIEGLRKFNSLAASGGRFRSTILPTGEGLTVGVKLR